MNYVPVKFPGARYGPDCQEGRVFQREEDVPKGWTDNPNDFDYEPAGNLTEINVLRAEYKDKFGKKPYMGWDEATLREKLG